MPFFMPLLVPLLLLFVPARPAAAQSSWLDFEDGEILNVSSADGPPAAEPFFQVRHSVEHSTLRGRMAINRMRVLYGVNSWLTAGVAGVHLEQSFHEFHKKGLGDTNLLLKVHYRPGDLPLRIGLRQSLSIPTGYEMERDGLARFTSGHNDYTAQVLVQALDSRFSTYVNPGVFLPGGDEGACLTGGLGFVCTLPLHLDGRGEYFTRWNMVDHKFDSEIFASVRVPMVLGLSVQAGLKRHLLQKEQVDPEVQLSLCFGRDRTPDTDVFEVRTPEHRTATGLLVHPIETTVPDPYGVAHELSESFRTGRADRLAVYVRTYSAQQVEPARGGRTYELNLRILQIDEADVSGLDAPPVIRIPRSRTEITAQYELIAPDGYSIVRRDVLHGVASKLIGFSLIPESGSVDATVTPDEVRTRLRASAARDLAGQILRDVTQAIDERDSQ
jgi:hypothetical protein